MATRSPSSTPGRVGRGMGLIVLASLLVYVAGCTREAPAGWSGYLEGEYVQVASGQAGTLTRLAVAEGASVQAGELLFTLEDTSEQAGTREAQARVAAAEAQARDTETGRRGDEVAVTQAQLAQARAAAGLARSELARQQQLLAQQFIAPAAVDNARAASVQAAARVAELEAALRVAALPARRETQRAAAAEAAAASAAAAQSAWRLAQTEKRAPVGGQVAVTYARAGEWVGVGQPVLALLPAGQVKALFFVPEDQVARLAPGQTVTLHCDGCGAPIPARISVIATQPEYTPPVIYSNAQRARLVFRVEARPSAAAAARLRPGLPIDVMPASAS
ncbi:MAG: HlyD family efflux transporter periplasmic adaptor subunit [Rubrivivax sp.]